MKIFTDSNKILKEYSENIADNIKTILFCYLGYRDFSHNLGPYSAETVLRYKN